MEQSPDTKPMPSRAARTLYLTAVMAGRVEFAHLGPDEIGKHSLSSRFVIKTFLLQHTSLAVEFLRRAGTDADALIHALDAPHEPEPQPEPRQLTEIPTEEQRGVYEMMKKLEDKRQAGGKSPLITRPLKEALRSAQGYAGVKGDPTYGVGGLVAALFETESIARDALFAVTDQASSDRAIKWLREQPDPDDGPDFMETNKAHMKEVLDRMWPKIREQSESRTSERMHTAREKHYEEDPDRYEKHIDVAERLSEHKLDVEKDYAWRVGVSLHAAGNEARIRRASECTLDHMLAALVRDGTDTAAFLDRTGVDRDQWANRLDALQPRFEEGLRWPPNDRSLGMSIPSNVRLERKSRPDGVDLANLTPEELREYVVRKVDVDRRFTDLVMLRKVHEEPQSVCFRLFLEAGITVDDLMAEIKARETGDSDWWLKGPDLIAKLAATDNNVLRDPCHKIEACVDAAQYEARMRGAPKVEFDDLLVALLRPGTDLGDLAESLGIDANALRSEVDAIRPKSEIHSMFPPSEDLRLHLGLGLTMLASGQYSDLLFLEWAYKTAEKDTNCPLSPGLGVLDKYGIDRHAIRHRLAEIGIELKE